MRLKDIAGQRFGRLVVVARAASNGKTKWACVCDCGLSKDVTAYHLTSGKTQSCGCYRRQRQSEANTEHGRAHTKEAYAWIHMKQRCSNPKNKSYPDYGGRGIRVCEEWLQSFDAFWRDMGPAPSATHTVERKDTNGHYTPGNCIWATRAAQNRNTRNTIRVVVDGRQVVLRDVCEERGLSFTKVYKRLRRGFSVEDALT